MYEKTLITQYVLVFGKRLLLLNITKKLTLFIYK